MKTLRFFALALVSAGLFSSISLADDTTPPTPPKKPWIGLFNPTTKGGEDKKGSENKLELKTTPIDLDKLGKIESKFEISRLASMLAQMNVKFDRKFDAKYNAEYFVVSEYGYDRFRFDLEESASKRYIWVVFPCTKVPETGAPAGIMENLMTKNGKMATAFFTFNPKTRMILLKMPIATQSLDSVELQKQINWLMKFANETRYLWDANSWDQKDESK